MPTTELLPEAPLELRARFASHLAHWVEHPVDFVCEVLNAQPDPWQCDVLDAIQWEENVAVRACHGVGKTALLSWAVLWFIFTRTFPKIPTTAPTFNKQVRDILWSEIHKWYRISQERTPWLSAFFEPTQTRLQHVKFPTEWFAVGIASSQPINTEGYHAPHLLAIFDEAKGISRATWESIHGMRTTQEAKFLVASTPGGPLGEFFNVFTRYRQTWRSLFIIRPESLRGEFPEALRDRVGPEAMPYSRSGEYFSTRVRPEWVRERRLEWGEDSPAFIARVCGEFPDVQGDVLIPYPWIIAAEEREEGLEGQRWISCDVARYGRDRTVFLVGEGGTLLHGETTARTAAESSAPEARSIGVGADPKRPMYRSVDITADICVRLRREWEAEGIVVDDTGLGGGVVDILRRRGERVIGINFGAVPTDRPQDAEERKSKQRRHLVDSNFVNLKAEIGWLLRGAFESGQIALSNLPGHILGPLIAQLALIKQEQDAQGRIRIVDPDEQEELPGIAVDEGRRSPDHFHALMLLWWAVGVKHRTARSGAPQQGLPQGVKRLGRPSDPRLGGQSVALQGRRPGVGGQAGWVRGRY